MIYLDITTVDGCVTNTQVTLVSRGLILGCCDQRIGMPYTSRSSAWEIHEALEEVSWASGRSKLKYFRREIQPPNTKPQNIISSEGRVRGQLLKKYHVCNTREVKAS